MKKIILFTLLLIGGSAYSQEVRTSKSTPFEPTKYTNDIVINSDTVLTQSRVRMSVAFNGWIYAAFSTVNISENRGGISILRSKDNGMNWDLMDSYSGIELRYPTFDIVVAGTDTTDLNLYLVGVNNNISTGNFTLFVDKYNATNGGFVGSFYNTNKGTRTIYDVSIASDYAYPAVGASPYSVAFIYSVYSTSYDSLNYVASIDGGASFTVSNNITRTTSFLKNVSLAYGRSSSGSNGRYFGAWELNTTSISRTGHIYTSRSATTITDAWITPVNLDSVSSAMIGLCKNPSIAVQFNDTDNDSSSTTAVVLVQRDYLEDGSDYDLLGFFNKRAHFTNFWNRLDIVNSGENDIQPDVSYDPVNNNFLAVFYDSTNAKLPYVVNGMNLATPSSWATITSQYNDDSNLAAAYPRVEINPAYTQTAHAWIANGDGGREVAMFDAEYLHTDINESSVIEFSNGMIYPNPASTEANISFTTIAATGVNINIYDMAGNLVESRVAQNMKSGNWFEKFNVADWSNGIYIVSISSANEAYNTKLIVSH